MRLSHDKRTIYNAFKTRVLYMLQFSIVEYK